MRFQSKWPNIWDHADSLGQMWDPLVSFKLRSGARYGPTEMKGGVIIHTAQASNEVIFERAADSTLSNISAMHAGGNKCFTTSRVCSGFFFLFLQCVDARSVINFSPHLYQSLSELGLHERRYTWSATYNSSADGALVAIYGNSPFMATWQIQMQSLKDVIA